MGLYDVVLGDGEQAVRGQVLLPLLDIEDVGRYRDCWVEKWPGGSLVIAVYTRNGGGNREAYAGVIRAMQESPHYVTDADDSFDSTYATFYFRVPDWIEAARSTLARIAVPPVDMSARWKEAMDRVQRGELKPSEIAMMDRLKAAIIDPAHNGAIMDPAHNDGEVRIFEV